MKLRRLVLALPFFLSALVFTCCNSQEAEADEAELPSISLGGTSLKIELALSSSEQRKGLMYREGIEDGYGMLFVYDEPTQMSFWMKNVDFPIHIGFFSADGVLREAYPMYANDTGTRKSIRDDLLYALEVNAGWFKKVGVKPGDRLDLEAVNQAIEKRRRN